MGEMSIIYHTAVHIEPPVTDKVLLIVESSWRFSLLNLSFHPVLVDTVGTKQGWDGSSSGRVGATDVVGLAVSLQVSVVALHQAATVEGGCRGRGEGGIVLTWSPGDGAL